MGDEILYMSGIVAVGLVVNFGLRALPFVLLGGKDLHGGGQAVQRRLPLFQPLGPPGERRHLLLQSRHTGAQLLFHYTPSSVGTASSKLSQVWRSASTPAQVSPMLSHSCQVR